MPSTPFNNLSRGMRTGGITPSGPIMRTGGITPAPTSRDSGFRANFYVYQDFLDKLREMGYRVEPYMVNTTSPEGFMAEYGRPNTELYGYPAWSTGRPNNDLVMRDDFTVFSISPAIIPRDQADDTPTVPPPVPPPPTTGGPSFPPSNQPTPIGAGKIFSKFNVDDIIPNQQELVTRALWSDNTGILETFFTSSLQNVDQKRYYYEIFNKETTEECKSEAQFSVTYGHRFGSGSDEPDAGANFMDTPTRAIYGQYRLLCLDSSDEGFIIDGQLEDSIYAININRARMLERLDEGNLELNLQSLNFHEFGGNPEEYTGSNVEVSSSQAVIRLIDDSRINPATIKQAGEVYNMVSGSLEDGVYNPSNPHIYGKLFKRKGIIVLSGTKLDASASFGTVVNQEVEGDNAYKLFLSISGAAQYNDGTNTPLGFIGRGSEKVKSTHYFVRVKNTDYNFSNNPSFVVGDEGDLRHADMYNDPKTYITTIGMYNREKELVAVAKLSQPVRKSFKDEALIKVRLDF